MNTKKVLIVEDDPEIVNLLKIHLSDLQCEIVAEMDGQKGLDRFSTFDPDLIILDITLPSMDGIEICRRVRSTSNVPIIMLTAKSEEIDRVLGLEIGADDYITKPFSVREFIARVKAVFRRTKMDVESAESQNEVVLNFENLSIDIEKRKVLLNGNKIELSPKEFELLTLMASKPGRSYTRSELLKLIWGYDFEGYEHTVNAHINRLRAKIEPDMASPTYIMTTWGIGYKFNEDVILHA
ncbi:response regulator transcription factor [Reichenbachiella versicolor]|uniref:response regulator transcription factor n=1 Tax=Reichenbachiella versicolor TaxID=1821036 RepID=UPI000D6E6D5A|nr:response regulator transcription factor [Reichenbachiella versicolor]